MFGCIGKTIGNCMQSMPRSYIKMQVIVRKLLKEEKNTGLKRKIGKGQLKHFLKEIYKTGKIRNIESQ